MNTKELKKMMDWKVTGMVKGVKVRGGVLPEVGNGASHGINGDSYGFIITEVAPDGTWFKYCSGKNGGWDGKAWFCTRKNSPLCGKYIMSDACTVGYREDRKPSMNARYAQYNIIWPLATKGAPETHLDPSF